MGDVMVKQNAPPGIGAHNQLHLVVKRETQTDRIKKILIRLKVPRHNRSIHVSADIEFGKFFRAKPRDEVDKRPRRQDL